MDNTTNKSHLGTPHHQGSTYTRTVVKDGILWCTFLTDRIDVEKARVIIDYRLAVQQGHAYPIIADMRSLSSTTKAARDLFASTKGQHLMVVCALLVESPLSRYIGNFFIRVNKPKVPTKIFTSKASALAWLREYQAKQ